MTEYNQFKEAFVPGLSIIDVLMFNSVEIIKEMLKQYELIVNTSKSICKSRIRFSFPIASVIFSLDNEGRIDAGYFS